MKTIANKVVLITGAGSGIGKSIAELFAKQGAHLMLSDIRYNNIEEVAKEIKNKGGLVSCYPADISKLQDVKSLIDYTLNKYKSIDVLVNNAGIMDDFAPVEDVSNESWEKIIGVNLNGPFFTCRAIVKIFKEQKSGVIINIASIAGLTGGRAGLAYTVSKHGLIGLTKSIAYQYAGTGLKCNAIAPGGVETNIMHDVEPNPFGYSRMNAGTGNMPEAGTPDDIAELALFLASAKSGFINGAVMVADGGWTAY
uniref:SDR family oxidoreductase n=1 Tax=Pedobacter schmidteae TaxID=2201271 RepID=UPI000EAD0C1F|nr:SDR family oxidoreductase [Pedobacter schmidteae]